MRYVSVMTLLILSGSTLATPAQQRPIRADRAGLNFVVRDSDLRKPITVIAYGDMRFTDPNNLAVTNARPRQALVERIAQERPDALLLNGDLTMHGGDEADYAVYQIETQAWRDAHLRIFPALGNHEFANCEVPQCLRNWWNTFPELKNHRWYSAQLGAKLYVIALDSNDSLLPGSPQQKWIKAQIDSLPNRVQFVLITMHHEPVGDVQVGADDNPRPNEMALADLLKMENPNSKARFVVVAGHIHNYEHFEQDGVVYLVSGGGGAPQQTIKRTPGDLYRDNSFPNFHYLKFVLNRDTLDATMCRLADPGSSAWEVKDAFKIKAKQSTLPRRAKTE